MAPLYASRDPKSTTPHAAMQSARVLRLYTLAPATDAWGPHTSAVHAVRGRRLHAQRGANLQARWLGGAPLAQFVPSMVCLVQRAGVETAL